MRLRRKISAVMAICLSALLIGCDSAGNSGNSSVVGDSVAIIPSDSTTAETQSTTVTTTEATSQEAPDTSPQDTSQEAPDTSPQDTSQAPDTSPQDTSQAPETSPQDTSQEAPDTSPQDTSQSTEVTAPDIEVIETPIEPCTKYIIAECVSRKSAVQGSEAIMLYRVNQTITVVAKTNTYYYKLENGGYIHMSFTSDTPNEDMPAADDLKPILPYVIDKYPYTVGNHVFEEGNVFYNVADVYNMPWKESLKRELSDGINQLWTSDGVKVTYADYNRDKVIEYAAENWSTGKEYCAEFAADCITAGGVEVDYTSSTALITELVNSGYGFAEFIPLQSDRTVILPEYAKAGDIIFYACSYEGYAIHTAVYSGNDKNGRAKAYAHNPYTNGNTTFKYYRICYSCRQPLAGIYFFHFYEKGETPSRLVNGISDNTLIFTRSLYALANQKYSPSAAVAYSENNRADCLGSHGAMHTTEALKAGGLTVGYPNNSALFYQLVLSGLGTVSEITLNEDGTATMPKYAKAGDVCFTMCRREDMMLGSFLVKGKDKNGLLIASAYDLLNKGSSPYIADGYCIACGGKADKLLLFHFE